MYIYTYTYIHIYIYLVENLDRPPFALGSRRVGHSELDALTRVLDVDKGACLAARAIDSQRDPASGLHTQNRRTCDKDGIVFIRVRGFPEHIICIPFLASKETDPRGRTVAEG